MRAVSPVLSIPIAPALPVITRDLPDEEVRKIASSLTLEREWVVWYSERVKKPVVPIRGGGRATAPKPEDAFMAPQRRSSFKTVGDYWRVVSGIPAPSRLIVDINIYVFQAATPPTWEHPDNVRGGRWTFSIDSKNFPAAVSDAAWLNTHVALVGETLDPGTEIVGIALARRRAYTRVSVWTRNREDSQMVLKIGATFKKVTGVPKLEYQDHGEAFETYRYVI